MYASCAHPSPPTLTHLSTPLPLRLQCASSCVNSFLSVCRPSFLWLPLVQSLDNIAVAQPYMMNYSEPLSMQVCPNGYISFGSQESSHIPRIFPHTDATVVGVAPFWVDHDVRNGGSISFEIHTTTTSPDLLSQVNQFIRNQQQSMFAGIWMLIAKWDNVPRFGTTTPVSRIISYLPVASRRLIANGFYQPGAREAHARLVLRLLYVLAFVCVHVRHPQLLHALSYVIPLLCHYSHERSGSYWKFEGSIGQGTSS